MNKTNENIFNEFKRILWRARTAQIKAQAAEQEVFKALEDMCIDPSLIESEAENAETLEQAITCFLQYGEYTAKDILRELRGAFGIEG